MSNTFVILMGMGVVFTGLICIVLLVTLTGKIVQALEKNAKTKTTEGKTDASMQQKFAVGAIPNRSELVAAISAVLAEELDTTVQRLRICSLKRVGEANYNRGELAAAISVAIAEDLGTNPAGIRILSMQKK